MALAPDQDWSRTIVWSPDSRKVGFVINDERLALFDTSTFELDAMLLLVADERLQLRLQTPEGRPMAVHGWARMETSDRRQVRVGFSSAVDGLVRLAAFDPGPFRIVELAQSRSQRTAVLRDVVIGETPLNVTLPAQ